MSSSTPRDQPCTSKESFEDFYSEVSFVMLFTAVGLAVANPTPTQKRTAMAKANQKAARKKKQNFLIHINKRFCDYFRR